MFFIDFQWKTKVFIGFYWSPSISIDFDGILCIFMIFWNPQSTAAPNVLSRCLHGDGGTFPPETCVLEQTFFSRFQKSWNRELKIPSLSKPKRSSMNFLKIPKGLVWTSWKYLQKIALGVESEALGLSRMRSEILPKNRSPFEYRS